MPGRRKRPEVFREPATTSATTILPPHQPTPAYRPTLSQHTPSQPTILPVHQPTPSNRPTFLARHSVSSFPSASHHSIPPTETFSTQVAPSYGISPELFHDSSGNFLALLGTFNQSHQQHQPQQQSTPQEQEQRSTPQEQEQQSTPQEQRRAARKQRRPRVSETNIVAVGKRSLCCTWKPEHDDQVIKNFHHLASDQLSGMLYEARQEYERRDGNFAPEWIGEEERQLGRKPFINEVHDATHKIWGTNEYIDTRSAVTQKKYDESVELYIREHPEYSSNADLNESTQLQLWDEISRPGNTDFRRYGYGNLAPNFEYGSISYIPTGEEQYRSATVPPEMQQTIDTMTQQLQSQNQEIQAQNQELQRRAQREKELEERLTKESEDRLQWQKQMEERFLHAYNSQPHGSTSRFDPSKNESDNECEDSDEE
ncbi:hypothetical protein QL285_075056 [Trifolium repens]|nr:hypothetical protein QL285_075056 [Trifolium repens]